MATAAVAFFAGAVIALGLLALPLHRRLAALERDRAERLLREEARLRQAVPAGDGRPDGKHRRRHLRVVPGGAAVAALVASAATLRGWWRGHALAGYATAAAGATLALGAAVYVADGGTQNMGQPPATGPSATAPPVETLTPGTPSRTPEDATSRTRPGRSTPPSPAATMLPSPNAPSPNGGDDTTAPPGDGEEGSSGDDADPEPPAETSPPDDDGPPGQEPSPGSLLCLQAALTPRPNVGACLP